MVEYHVPFYGHFDLVLDLWPGKNSTFLEYGHVAYQNKGDEIHYNIQ